MAKRIVANTKKKKAIAETAKHKDKAWKNLSAKDKDYIAYLTAVRGGYFDGKFE